MATASRAVFDADLARFDAALRAYGAIKTGTAPEGGTFTYLDSDKAPGPLLRSYQRLISYGFANGLI